ncbi:MAG TPA: hypothetical protein VHX14_14440 [Thermoanaerobaculia bacterium]|nr:hypothetical protein [Thermoanaerobaculia bacterium]
MSRTKTAKPASKKPAARAAAKAKPVAKKPAPKKPAAAKKAVVKKPAPKKAAAKKVAVKKPAPAKSAKKAAAKPPSGKAAKAAPKKVVKPAAKASAKSAAKTPAKPAPKTTPKAAKPAKAEKATDAKQKPSTKTVVKAGAAPAVARPAAPAADDKKRRRSRTRVTSNGPATAAWFSQGDRPRSSSFIPAPPRAEAPSLVAAPPASSDRLVGAHELTEFAVRTTPVRIDIESSGGRIYLSINPNETNLRAGEGIEWDFRYLGGADVVIEELIIEFAKPSPFVTTVFRSRRPGAARPHRQLSGPAQESAAGKHLQYTVRAFNAFKTEMASLPSALSVS